jgi:hypothetical protein
MGESFLLLKIQSLHDRVRTFARDFLGGRSIQGGEGYCNSASELYRVRIFSGVIGDQCLPSNILAATNVQSAN